MGILSSIDALFKSWMEPDRKNKASPDVFINQAIFLPELNPMQARGVYPKGYPEGLIIHYTAGSQNQSAYSAIDLANKNGHQYFFIDKDGTLYQQFDLKNWGYHAGKSICPITKRENVSRFYAGVEIACPGLLEFKQNKFYTWYNQEIPKDKTRYFGGTITQRIGGSFHTFTPEQENTLFSLCIMFCEQFDISPQFILGHDEVSPGRKADPGGSLSMSMDEFRDKLRIELNRRMTIYPA